MDTTVDSNPARPVSLRHLFDEETIDFVVVPSSLGLVLVAHGARGVCAVLLGDDAESLRREVRGLFPQADLCDGGDDMRRLAANVTACIETPTRPIDFPIEMRGTTFQKAVWTRLCAIPVGTTVSYGDIAVSLALPASARAVAQACAANSLAVVVPCHRVVRRDGSLSGYRWGASRKAALLARESAA